MTHRHEWELDTYEPFAWCDCGAHMWKEEIKRRLNATERLKAEEARALLSTFKLGDYVINWALLHEYADILEGKEGIVEWPKKV